MNEVCTDNRFDIIAAYKRDLLDGTNIETSPDEMAVIDNILFRFWQMGWLLPTPRTNADRIRAMTDEELAGWIIKHDCHTFLYEYDPKDAVFDWLKQEIQE